MTHRAVDEGTCLEEVAVVATVLEEEEEEGKFSVCLVHVHVTAHSFAFVPFFFATLLGRSLSTF